MKVKRYFHLRDDIYEYISIHWDVICRRERIKNWRHTIGMTLSHYQNLFQNGYHIYQNTGYWSMKDNVPSPYVIDPLIGGGDGSSPGKKRKYSHTKSSSGFTDKEKDTNLTPFISDFSISQDTTSSSGITNTSNDNNENDNKNNNNDKDSNNSHHKDGDNLGKAVTLPPFNLTSNSLLPSPQVLLGQNSSSMTSVRFDEMKNEIDRFKREMNSLQSEIDSLQEQLQVKKAEEHLLKFLQEGISAFRDKIKSRIELLRNEMINNHSEHQQQIHNMASELTQLREIGADLRTAFQYQFARLVNLNTPQH
jgi:hypothetical protein